MSDVLKALERLIDQASNTAEDGFKVFEDAELVRSALHQQEQAEPVAIVRRFESGFPNDDDDLIVEPTQAAVTLKPNDPLYRHPPSAVSDGYALVPTSPTPEMLKAAADVECKGLRGFVDRRVYIAMLAAAPQPKETGE